jgi:GTP-binding protein EngB required for normal cell division
MYEYLLSFGLDICIIVNKIDRLKNSEVKKSLDYVIDSFKNEQVLSASSKTSVGK